MRQLPTNCYGLDKEGGALAEGAEATLMLNVAAAVPRGRLHHRRPGKSQAGVQVFAHVRTWIPAKKHAGMTTNFS